MLKIAPFFLLILLSCTQPVNKEKSPIAKEYVCIPCGYECDKAVHTKPGTCSSCKMELVLKETIAHKDINPAELCSMSGTNIVFLDVRTPGEFAGTAPDKFGAIKNAINIPVQQLAQRLNELQEFKGRKIVVYCSHAHRSAAASYLLTQNGYGQVFNMLGGMSVWKDEVKAGECNRLLYIQQ
ncbi:MAG: rhodanese-like domain-containing protein [Ferruginibacter sp.]